MTKTTALIGLIFASFTLVAQSEISENTDESALSGDDSLLIYIGGLYRGEKPADTIFSRSEILTTELNMRAGALLYWRPFAFLSLHGGGIFIANGNGDRFFAKEIFGDISLKNFILAYGVMQTPVSALTTSELSAEAQFARPQEVELPRRTKGSLYLTGNFGGVSVKVGLCDRDTSPEYHASIIYKLDAHTQVGAALYYRRVDYCMGGAVAWTFPFSLLGIDFRNKSFLTYESPDVYTNMYRDVPSLYGETNISFGKNFKTALYMDYHAENVYREEGNIGLCVQETACGIRHTFMSDARKAGAIMAAGLRYRDDVLYADVRFVANLNVRVK